MNLGTNLQFLRRMHNSMTQEDLAEKIQVSRQTVSKWELDAACPEIEKAIEICRLFSCSMDDLFRTDMNVLDESYSNIRVESVDEFRYLRYAVISMEPEYDAISHVKGWADCYGDKQPQIIGWDFPVLSQEQINVYHFHGYAAAWILPTGITVNDKKAEVITQAKQKYAAITISEPMKAPFIIIPKAYKTLTAYMKVNGLEHKNDRITIDCFEKEYTADGKQYMDVYIAVK